MVLNARDEKGKGCYDICKLQALSEKDKRPLEMLKWMGALQMSDLTGTTTGNRALPLSAACDEECSSQLVTKNAPRSEEWV